MNHLKILMAASALTLPACVATSFAPPAVNRYSVMKAESLTRECRLTGTVGGTINQDVSGTISLVDNYHASYDCWRGLAANGRQYFQIPAFLSLIGSTTAVALGAGQNVAILGSAGNSASNAANNYYSPAEQTEILNHALDAISCIRSEATGTPAYTALAPASSQQRAAMNALGLTGAQVEITYERQYHGMVRSRLEAIDHIVAQRLSRRGSFDPAGVAAEIREAAQKIRDQTGANPPSGGQGVATLFSSRLSANVVQAIQLQLALLQPKLDQCVLRAKS